MRRVYCLEDGKLLLARHLIRGYRYLLSLDRGHHHQFTVVGVNGLLCRRFGRHLGETIHLMLKEAGLIKPLGRDKVDGGKKVFRIIRKDVGVMNVGYLRRKRGAVTRHRSSSTRPRPPIIDDQDAIRLPRRVRPKVQHSHLPNRLVRELMKYVPNATREMPIRVIVHFVYHGARKPKQKP